MKYTIRIMDEPPPIDLLLLADESEEMVNRYISKCFYLGLFDTNDTCFGAACVEPIDTNTWEIINIAVNTDQQGLGFGKHLVGRVIQDASARGIQNLLVGTADASIGNIAFYQKCGFEMDHIRIDFFKEHYPNAIEKNGLPIKHMMVFKYPF